METINIEKFDPTKAELNLMIEKTSKITATDLKDKKQLEVVKENRIQLKNARVKITKIGKELREEAIAFQKAVIAKEKELIGIIEPEEERLSAIEEEAKTIAIKEARMALLPERKEKLSLINIQKTDDELLSMDDIQFSTFYNECVAEKQRIEQEKLEAEKRAIEEEKNKIARAKEIEEAKAQAIEEEKKRASEQEELNKAREEARIKAEKEKLEKQKAFIEFRESFGYTEDTKNDFKIEETSDGYTLYKKLGTFKK